MGVSRNNQQSYAALMREFVKVLRSKQPVCGCFFVSNHTKRKVAMTSKKITFIDLFAGIGGFHLAFHNLGAECVFVSEWDEPARKTYEANFKKISPNIFKKDKDGKDNFAGDITKVEAKDIPDFDILTGGFPCQPFSIIGAKAGFEHETQGTLFFDIERILSEKQPKAFILENVRNLTAHDKGKTFKVIIEHLEKLGYFVHYKVLNALDYGVPQKRERIIIVGFKQNVPFKFPETIPRAKRTTIKSILEKGEIDETYFVREEIRERRHDKMLTKTITEPQRPYITHENVGGSITPHNYSCALRAGASANYLLVNNERRPTGRELLRIQGFPDWYQIVVPYSSIRKQTGNAVAVPVIEAVAREVMKSLSYFDKETDNG
jgi:DNA (cytosine-5)-methyltransferase 1